MLKFTMPTEGNFYRGNIHAHTNLSDGHDSLEDTVLRYKEKGYSFLAITDHNFYTLKNEFSTDSFKLLGGCEIGCYKNGFHHVLAIGDPDTTKYKDGKTFAADMRYNTPVYEIVMDIHDNGNIAIYAHPASSGTDINALLENVNFEGIEIFDAMHEKTEKNGFADIYFDQMCSLSPKTFCYAADNTHNLAAAFEGSVVIKTDKLTNASIIDALMRGAFYSSYAKDGKDPVEINNFYIDEEGFAVLDCSKCRSVFIMTDMDSKLYEGPLHAPITFAKHKIPEGAAYVRAVCTHECGSIAWTQPIIL